MSYCGDHLDDWQVIYLQGTNGNLTNMDIDCDGVLGTSADDGRCFAGTDSDTQGITAMKEEIQKYTSHKDLNPFLHPYVVFGNQGSRSGYVNFDPQKYDIMPLSLMLVVCNGQMVSFDPHSSVLFPAAMICLPRGAKLTWRQFYGIWGDTNGDEHKEALVGEASIGLASLCFPKEGIDNFHGHDANDVLYVAFPGTKAVPGHYGANWSAANASEFEKSMGLLGDSLIERIGSGDASRAGSGKLDGLGLLFETLANNVTGISILLASIATVHALWWAVS